MSVAIGATKSGGLLSSVSGRLAPLRRRLDRFGRADLILAAVIVIALVANAVLLATYLGAASQRSSLTRQVQDTQHRADELAQGAVPNATPVPGRIVVPQEIVSADVMDLFLKTAQESSVEIVSVNEQGVSSVRVGDRDLRSFRFGVQLRARASQLMAFLNRLEQAQYSPLLIDNLSAKPQGNQTWSVTLNIVSYALPKG